MTNNEKEIVEAITKVINSLKDIRACKDYDSDCANCRLNKLRKELIEYKKLYK